MNARTLRHVVYSLTICIIVLSGALAGATCGVASAHRGAVRAGR